MLGICDWAKDLLVSRGALVEEEESESFRALLPDEVAKAVGASEWLRLQFGSEAGADDGGEWLERLGALLPTQPRIVNARLRHFSTAPRIDAAAVLDREFAVQNGIYRVVEDYASSANYYLFSFHYIVDSDERSTGVVNVCLNPAVRSVTSQSDHLLRAIEAELEPASGVELEGKVFTGLYRVAERAARREIRKAIAGIEDSTSRRLARDTERVRSYYRGLMAQIEKRVARRAADPEAAEKERARARATELDRDAKLEDLWRKHSLRIQVLLTDVLTMALPVREISIRLIRKKEERLKPLHWNATLRQLDAPWCEKCGVAARPLFLCEAMHCLCKDCFAACAQCGRVFCRVCQPRCKCGG